MSGTQSALTGISSGIKPNGLLNGSSTLSVAPTTGNYPSVRGAKKVVTGAQTAGVLSTVLSLSGKGSIDFLMVSSVNSTTRTHRLKVTLDGIIIFDATSTSVATIGAYCPCIGCIASEDTTIASYAAVGYPLIFDTSLLIEYASSITETALSAISYRYTPRA